jgi:hypothetical protein
MDFNRKGEVISVIFLIIIALVALSVFYQQEPVLLNFDLGSSSEIISEVDLNVDRAILTSMQEFLEGGFSDYENGEVWFCDSQYPVDFKTEANTSLHRILEKNINTAITVLEDSGFEIDYPTIEVVTNFTTYDLLKSQPIIIVLSDFYVYSQGENVVLKEDLSRIHEKDWPVWELYVGFHSWMSDNAGDFEATIKRELFEEQSCQAILSNCNCEQGDLLDEATKKGLRLDSGEVYQVLDTVRRNLELRFNTSTITCEFSVENIKIENDEYSAYIESLSSIYNNAPGLIEKRSDYTYSYGKFDVNYGFPDGSRFSNYGCPLNENEADERGSDFTGITREPTEYVAELPSVDFNEDRIIDPTGINFSFYESNYLGETCQDEEVSSKISQKSQLYSVSKKLALLVNMKCEDSSIQIDENTNLFTEVKLRLAVGESCPLPFKENVNTEDRLPMCLDSGEGGESDLGTCSTEDPCNPCQFCDGVDPFTGYGSCQPLPLGVPTNITCEMCDGNGSTMPQPQTEACGEECHSCDGITVGESACKAATPENGLYNESNPMTCNGEIACAVCSITATCDGSAPAEFYENNVIDSSMCGPCEACGLNFLNVSACVANLEDNGEFIPGRECAVCNNGTIVSAPTGSKDREDCSTCEVCTAGGTCGYDSVFTPQSRDSCSVCQTCGGSVGSGARCVADLTQDGNACGNRYTNKCNTCSSGSCTAELDNVGNWCKTARGCTFGCSETGSCNVATNPGDFCAKIFPVPDHLSCLTGDLPGVCRSNGFCGQQAWPTLPEGQKCCGDILCGESEECCDLGTQFICGSCEDDTT